MEYQLRETPEGCEVLRMRPEVVARFTDCGLARDFVAFLDGRDGAEVSGPTLEQLAPRSAEAVVREGFESLGRCAAEAARDIEEAVRGEVDAAPGAPEGDPEEWTEAELVEAFTRLGRKERVKDVADDYGKSWTSLRARWAREKASRRQAGVKPAAAPEPAAEAPEVTQKPDPAPRGLEAGTSPFMIDLDKARTGAERLLRMHLRAVGYRAPWSPALDLQLVEGLARGDGLGTAAAGLDLSLDACRARWKALLPEVTLDGQQQLLATLRALVAETAQAAA